jgi:uncharacterized protein (TIGR01777 family)
MVDRSEEVALQILMTGGTGLIGKALIGELRARGDQVAVVTRSASRASVELPDDVELVEADPNEPGPWLDRAMVADAVINLVGESVGEGIWTRGKKRRIRRSRLRPTSHLADALRERDADRPCVLLNASATGYYGDGGDRALAEDAEPGQDYLAMLCYEWERHALRAESERCRVVCLRFGVILAGEGGALAKMLPIFKRGLGGPLGSGRQYFPWIHLRDAARAILFALDTPAVRGAVNVTTPDPPRQVEFARALGGHLGKPARLPAPAWALRLLLGEKGNLLLFSQRAVPNRLKAHGFRWTFGELDRALDDVVGSA